MSVHQADGSSQLQVVGETRISFSRGDKVFNFEGLVVEDLDVDILAGTPFMESNDITVRPAKRQVILGDGTIYVYGSSAPAVSGAAARCAFVLRAPSHIQTVWPGEFLEMELPEEAQSDAEYAIEPRSAPQSVRRLKPSGMWPRPSIVSSVAGKIRIPNLSSEPQTLK